MVAKAEHYNKSECPIACALDLIGDHWALLVVRDLMFLERHEYKDMLAGEEEISSNILSNRLNRLQNFEIIASVPHPESKRRKLYYLTEKGKDLFDVLMAIVRWADKHLEDIIFIPEEKRALLEAPQEEVEQKMRLDLAEWEALYLPSEP